MRVAHDLDELARVFPIAQQEAQASFGQGGLYLERLIERAHHVEIQIAADRHGNVVHLGERECSVQRRHQKMIEESPSPMLSQARRAEMGDIACAGVASIVGVSGNSRGSAPNEPSALATALAMVPPAAMMPPSPAPFAPSGLIGEG